MFRHFSARFLLVWGNSLMKLAVRIAGVIALSVLPVLAMQIYNSDQLYQARQTEIRQSALRQAELTASELNRMVEGIRGTMMAVAQTPAVRTMDSVLCSAFIIRLTQQLKSLPTIVAADDKGQLRCAPSANQLKVNIADRRYFQDSMQNDDLVIGEYLIGRASQTAVLPLAVPILDDTGRHVGVVVSAIDLNWLSAQLVKRGVPIGGSVTIADRHGVILAREPLPEKFIGTKIPDQFMYLLSEANPGVINVNSQDGTERLLGYVPLPNRPSGLYVSAGISQKESFLFIDIAIWRQILGVVFSILTAVLLAYYLAHRYISQPFEQLLATVKRWQAFDFSAKTGLLPSQGEPGILGDQFDRTIDLVVKREESVNILLRELAHRSKNQLTLLVSLTNRLSQGQKTVPEFRNAIIERLLALSASQDLLLQNDGHAIEIEKLILTQLKSFDIDRLKQVSLSGPPIILSDARLRSLGMAIHELGTNAIKYGALSTKRGRVHISWKVTRLAVSWIELTWVESGGPRVKMPEVSGFGRTLIEKIVPLQLNGEAKLTYESGGIVWFIKFIEIADAKLEALPRNATG